MVDDEREEGRAGPPCRGQTTPIDLFGRPAYVRPSGSLFKWIGNKFKVAEEITSYFPKEIGAFYDVFVGGGSILATVAPARGVGSDSFAPLIEIWTAIRSAPDTVKGWYEQRWRHAMAGDRRERYEEIKAAYAGRRSSAYRSRQLRQAG